VKPTALILGGAGFIGSNLARRLLEAGEQVVVFDNLSRTNVEKNADWLSRSFGSRCEITVADVRDERALRQAVARADSVFHLAAQVAVTTSLRNPLTDFDVNAKGTLRVLEALRARSSPPPLFFTSTNKVYGGLEDLALILGESGYEPADPEARARGISESRPLDFHSPYGCSKGAADQYVNDYARSFGLKTVVFRMSCIYGPRQFGNEDQGWVAHFMSRVLRGEPITLYGDGRQVRDVLFVDDLLDAFLSARDAIDRCAGHAFNIGGGPERAISLLGALSTIRELTGKRVDLGAEPWRVGDQRYYVTDSRKFQGMTGWRPRVSVADGFAQLARWLLDGDRAAPAAGEAYGAEAMR
jgi:CDP-paratose 2-epimerase